MLYWLNAKTIIFATKNGKKCTSIDIFLSSFPTKIFTINMSTITLDAPVSQNQEKVNYTKQIYTGQVVANDDPKGLGRVKVELQGLTQSLKKDSLPWFHVMLPAGLGGSTYSQMNFAIPQVNTSVVVMFPTEDIYSGIVIGTLVNRVTFPDDKMNLAVDYIHPKSSEHHFTENWDKVDDTVKDQKHFSPDFSDDYPFAWGWVTPSLTWFKENLMKRTIEFVHNSFTKWKIYWNGDTVIHITGNLKLVVEKDFYMEIRGNEDHIVFNSLYEHIIGNHITQVEQLRMQDDKRGNKISGKSVVLN